MKNMFRLLTTCMNNINYSKDRRKILPMSKAFKMLREKMSKPAQDAAATKTQEMLKAMPLQELRQAHQMSQERLSPLFKNDHHQKGTKK
jgi:hypothetical protein